MAAGAESIKVRQKTAWVTVEGEPVGSPPEVSPRDWIAQAWQSQVPGIRYLTCALVGAWSLLASLRQEAPELIARTCEHLRSWKPGLRFTNLSTAGLGGLVAGGALGFGLMAVTGLAAPLHFLAIPGAILGTCAGSHYWRRRALKTLRMKLDQAARSHEGQRGGATDPG
ncbi:hypothetical protein DYH09_14735 [bacterium CPR1]|nr:hypothetical protein [bacterium CPR1]